MTHISSTVPRFGLRESEIGRKNNIVVEEINGLLRVYKNGFVERPQLIPNVHSTTGLGASLMARDVIIDKFTNLWTRIYVPTLPAKLPLLIYFHGGGFCVGSASWSCYHDFLSNLASKSSCVILSVNYRLAPESRLPTAYEDGANVITWVKQNAISVSNEHKWWLSKCKFSSLFLGGDSAGANIVYHVGSNSTIFTKPLCLKGIILIQPYFGGESRKVSEKNSKQPPNSALTLSTSDTYWCLSLPIGANRDHPWCNPLGNGAPNMSISSTVLVCISEMDILKDRNIELCNALTNTGNKVEAIMYKGVGHGFQILHNSPLSQARTEEMMFHLKSFIDKHQ